MSVKTIHRCGECRHPAHDHSHNSGTTCSINYCPCQLTPTQVEQDGEAAQVATNPCPSHRTPEEERAFQLRSGEAKKCPSCHHVYPARQGHTCNLSAVK